MKSFIRFLSIILLITFASMPIASAAPQRVLSTAVFEKMPLDTANSMVQSKGLIASVVAGAMALLASPAGQSTISHIMQAKHLWSRVGATTWTQVSKIIEGVLRYGTTEKVVNGVYYITRLYNGQVVEVRGKFVQDVFRISTAFVRQ